MEKHSIGWWIVFILLCIWQIPQLLVAVIMMPFLGKIELIAYRHFNFCYKAEKMNGAISLGPIAFVSNYSSKNECVIAHELDGHTMQSKILGIFYLLVIGIPSIIWAGTYDYKKTCYYSFYTESNANYFAKLEVTENCQLHFK